MASSCARPTDVVERYNAVRVCQQQGVSVRGEKGTGVMGGGCVRGWRRQGGSHRGRQAPGTWAVRRGSVRGGVRRGERTFEKYTFRVLLGRRTAVLQYYLKAMITVVIITVCQTIYYTGVSKDIIQGEYDHYHEPQSNQQKFTC